VERHTSGPPKRQYVETAPCAKARHVVVIGAPSFCCTCKPSYAYGECECCDSYHIRPRQKEMCIVMVTEHAPFRWPFLFRVCVCVGSGHTRACTCMCTQYNVRLDVCDSLYLELDRERRLSVLAVHAVGKLTRGEWLSVPPGQSTHLSTATHARSKWRRITGGWESDSQWG
jgi:hypothetical protein